LAQQQSFCAWHLQGLENDLHLRLNFSYLHLANSADRLFILRPHRSCSLVTQLTGDWPHGTSMWIREPEVMLYYVASSAGGFSLDWEVVRPPSLLHGPPGDNSNKAVPTEAQRLLSDHSAAAEHRDSAPQSSEPNSCLFALGLVQPLPDGGEVPVDFVPNCGSDQAGSSSGVIVSPANFGRTNRRCIWRVRASPQQLRIVIEVDREDNISYWDRLFVLQSGCRPLSGDGGGGEILTSGTHVIDGNTFSVYFYTDENIIPRKFRIFWHTM
jgi:hypothetical protein